MKYDKKRIDRLFELVSQGKHPIHECCEIVGISKETFYKWKKNKLDFSDRLELAIEQRYDIYRERAMSGLYKLIDTYEYDEVKTDFKPAKKDGEKPQVIGQSRTKKIVMPNGRMISYALNNLHPEKFKNTQNIDHTNNGGAFSFGDFLMQSTVATTDNNSGIENTEPLGN